MDATMRRERLENLYRVVKAAPGERFDMRRWWDDETDCGSAGCAIGWCARDAYFQRAGLCMKRGNSGLGRFVPFLDGRPVGGGDIGIDVFGVTFEQGHHLFNPTTYDMTEAEDGRRIRKVSVLARIVALIDATPKPVVVPESRTPERVS